MGGAHVVALRRFFHRLRFSITPATVIPFRRRPGSSIDDAGDGAPQRPRPDWTPAFVGVELVPGLSLLPHPDFPTRAITAVSVDAGRKPGGDIALRYYVEGNLEAVVWPTPVEHPQRADHLWQHTCFEAFVGFDADPSYYELNFSPAGCWAAYRFDHYRTGGRDVANALLRGGLTVSTTRVHAKLPDLDDQREWRLGLSAIFETRDGAKSYWALRHPPGKPDFHHVDCFAARIAAPTPP